MHRPSKAWSKSVLGLVEKLREIGAQEFECAAFNVKFGPEKATKARKVVEEEEEVEEENEADVIRKILGAEVPSREDFLFMGVGEKPKEGKGIFDGKI
jgi:ribosome maturation protein Sdo1